MLGRTELPAWIAVVGREGILSRLGFRPHLIRKGASARRGLRGGGGAHAHWVYFIQWARCIHDSWFMVDEFIFVLKPGGVLVEIGKFGLHHTCIY